MFVRGHTFNRKLFILNVTFRLKALSLQHMETRMVLIKFYIWGLKVTDEGETDEGSDEEELDVFFF